jgi:hypothetical protein
MLLPGRQGKIQTAAQMAWKDFNVKLKDRSMQIAPVLFGAIGSQEYPLDKVQINV